MAADKKSKNTLFFAASLFIMGFCFLIFSCASGKTEEDSDIIELTEFEEEIIQEPEIQEEQPVVWHSANSLNELTGKWVTPEGTIEFPVEIDDREYLAITYEETKDSILWKEFTQKSGYDIQQVWENRYLFIPEIYGINYPVSDQNGTQFGIKPELVTYINSKSALIKSYKQLLIPVDLVYTNLSFFKLSEDGSQIKAEGRFRFFSNTFMNMDDTFKVTLNASEKRNTAIEHYGLVLSGGGGKGAYEVGVWKAFLDYGIAQKIRAVSGTSVGGLNSALFTVEDYDTLENIWITKVPDKLTQDDALISQEGLTEVINSIPIKDLQNKLFPQAYVTAVRNRFILAKLVKSKPGQYATRFNLNSETDIEQIKKKLLATSAFPIVCPSVKLADGYEYSDGGNEAVGGDNTPIDPIVQNHPDIEKIFIVYLAHEPSRKIREIDYDTKELVQIIPSIELGGILDGTTNFTSNRIKLLIKYGYEDAAKILQSNGFYPVSSSWWFTEDTPF